MRSDFFRSMGACFGMGGLSTSNMRVVSGRLGNMLRLADLCTSRPHNVSYVLAKVLDTQSVFEELLRRHNEKSVFALI